MVNIRYKDLGRIKIIFISLKINIHRPDILTHYSYYLYVYPIIKRILMMFKYQLLMFKKEGRQNRQNLTGNKQENVCSGSRDDQGV